VNLNPSRTFCINLNHLALTFIAELVTFIGGFIAALLLLSEVVSFASVDLVSSIGVDLDRHREVTVHFDITFRKMACTGTFPSKSGVSRTQIASLVVDLIAPLVTQIDAVDEFGSQHFVPDDKMVKTPVTYVDKQGTTFSGCRIRGELVVSKIKGQLLANQAEKCLNLHPRKHPLCSWHCIKLRGFPYSQC
jgi:hypothetical protein